MNPPGKINLKSLSGLLGCRSQRDEQGVCFRMLQDLFCWWTRAECAGSSPLDWGHSHLLLIILLLLFFQSAGAGFWRGCGQKSPSGRLWMLDWTRPRETWSDFQCGSVCQRGCNTDPHRAENQTPQPFRYSVTSRLKLPSFESPAFLPKGESRLCVRSVTGQRGKWLRDTAGVPVWGKKWGQCKIPNRQEMACGVQTECWAALGQGAVLSYPA